MSTAGVGSRIIILNGIASLLGGAAFLGRINESAFRSHPMKLGRKAILLNTG